MVLCAPHGIEMLSIFGTDTPLTMVASMALDVNLVKTGWVELLDCALQLFDKRQLLPRSVAPFT